MAPINFEENIREQLEKREIKPSGQAWEKLNAQLDKKQEPKNNKAFWYAIAAALVGLLIAVSIFGNRTNKASDAVQSEIVEVNASEKNETETPIHSDDKIVPEKDKTSDMVASEDISEENEVKNNPVVVKEAIQKTEEGKTINKKEYVSEAIANNIQKSENIEPNPILKKSNLKEEDALINLKVEEVVAHIEQLKKENTSVTAEDIDALLQSAQKEISKNRILSSYKVDATALLDDVEFELERSFRDKVFDALGDGFEKIRTAVVERNN